MQEDNVLLLGALENILGKGYKRARGNYEFHCPFCQHRKPKLEINLDINSNSFGYWECWVCQTKGRSILSLLRHLGSSEVEIHQVLQYIPNKDLNISTESLPTVVRLPDEYKSLYTSPIDSYEANRFKQYLFNRGLSENDFIKYNIGYCSTGKYADRIIFPSYNAQNMLNYFTGRSVLPDAYIRYLNPDVSRDIIFNENLINWNESVILCEGVFDAMSLKRNSVCLLGKQISNSLMKKIIENPVPEIYVCLDGDALSSALKHCKTFLDMGKKVYLVRPSDKDPSEEGFVRVTRQLQQAKELTFADFIKYKMESNGY